MSQQQTMEQKRASAAWDCVYSKVKGKSYAKEYGQLARSAAADIQVNGLGQTVAFWRAKGKNGQNAHSQLEAHVAEWIKQQMKIQQPLMEWISKKATTNEYRRATAETLAFLVWLRRFAEAELLD